MSDNARAQQGDLIQSYVRAKWRAPDNTAEIERLGRRLDPALRGRVDAIGMDDQELLQIPDHAVLKRLDDLEREGEREVAQALGGGREIGRERSDDRFRVPKRPRRNRRVRGG